MSVPRARILDLAQCQVFATSYNPEGVRMGNKVLRQRLRGPAMAAYYPRKTATIKDLKREFGPTLATWDEGEEDRFEYIEELKLRGKSAPKKKKGPPGMSIVPCREKLLTPDSSHWQEAINQTIMTTIFPMLALAAKRHLTMDHEC
ncbi:hypothetical protein BFJ68_g15029 [Fusarium oxysporum]|uniref:Small ribosomal subunit protein mS33 n=1 Tax=Fusarium oxysporum TaxID=5507 RepID=A0A420PR07_FUSOX|nr:hypothetical protein BFJ68_g15029 [Fusarium oxysporum]